MFKAWAFAVMFCAASVSASAQSELKGVVTDFGGVLPGVRVTVTSATDRSERNVLTDGSGRYEISDLADGTYEVVFTFPGFATLRDSVILSADARTVDAHLTVGPGVPDVLQPFGSLWNGWIGSTEDAWSQLPCDRISMEDTGPGLIFTPGARFRVTFRRGGQAELARYDVSDRPTRLVSSISREEFGKLCYLADVLKFDEVANTTGTLVSDAGTVIIQITSNGHTKSMRELEGGGPIEVWALERAIDDIKGWTRWRAR